MSSAEPEKVVSQILKFDTGFFLWIVRFFLPDPVLEYVDPEKLA